MSAVALTLYPTRPAEAAVPEVTAPVTVALDDITGVIVLLVRRERRQPELTSLNGQPLPPCTVSRSGFRRNSRKGPLPV